MRSFFIWNYLLNFRVVWVTGKYIQDKLFNLSPKLILSFVIFVSCLAHTKNLALQHQRGCIGISFYGFNLVNQLNRSIVGTKGRLSVFECWYWSRFFWVGFQVVILFNERSAIINQLFDFWILSWGFNSYLIGCKF